MKRIGSLENFNQFLSSLEITPDSSILYQLYQKYPDKVYKFLVNCKDKKQEKLDQYYDLLIMLNYETLSSVDLFNGYIDDIKKNVPSIKSSVKLSRVLYELQKYLDEVTIYRVRSNRKIYQILVTDKDLLYNELKKLVMEDII